MLKREMAELLAGDEYSVKIGQQTLTYWTNVYMRDYRVAELAELCEAATMTDRVEAEQIRNRVKSAAWNRRR